MPQTRGTFPALYDGVRKTVLMLLGEEVKALPTIYTKYFTVKPSSRKFERLVTGVGFTDIPEKGEGAAYSTDQFEQGYTKDFTHVEFGRLYEVTETAMEDDEEDVLRQKSKWLAYAARYTQEKYAANILNNGFTTETAADGSAIFATHTLKRGGTVSNAGTDDLSATSLMDAMTSLQGQKLDSGQIVAPIMSFKIIVPPALETTAFRLIESEGLPGIADNDKNPIKGLRSWSVVVNPLLTDTDAWFIAAADKGMHGLTSYQRIPISVKEPEPDSRTGNLLFKLRFRQSWGCTVWQGLYGSPGG